MTPGRTPKRVRVTGRAGLLALATLLVGGWASADAQIVAVGLVTEGIFGRAAENVVITLSELGGEGDSVVVTTDQAGRFAALLPGPGTYEVTARHLRYAPLTWGPLEATEAEDVIELLIELQPQVTAIEGLSVEVEEETRLVPSLALNGFYRRERRGLGSHVTPEDLENRRSNLAVALRKVPGIRVSSDGRGVRIAGGARTFQSGPLCKPTMLVDGMVFDGDGTELLDVVSLQDVLAMEVYTRASSIPGEYGRFFGLCGVVLVWTRR